jgi:hypothetical protein
MYPRIEARSAVVARGAGDFDRPSIEQPAVARAQRLDQVLGAAWPANQFQHAFDPTMKPSRVFGNRAHTIIAQPLAYPCDEVDRFARRIDYRRRKNSDQRRRHIAIARRGSSERSYPSNHAAAAVDGVNLVGFGRDDNIRTEHQRLRIRLAVDSRIEQLTEPAALEKRRGQRRFGSIPTGTRIVIERGDFRRGCRADVEQKQRRAGQRNRQSTPIRQERGSVSAWMLRHRDIVARRSWCIARRTAASSSGG